MPGNSIVWRLWLLVKTQWRAGGMGAIGLDYPAVKMIAKIYKIKLNIRIMNKIRLLESKQLELWRKAGDNDGEK